MDHSGKHIYYASFPFRYKSGKFYQKLGYICIGVSMLDGEPLATVAGSACSVSEEKFLPWKGQRLAKGRVDCERKHIKKIEKMLDVLQRYTMSQIIAELRLRPTCSYMDEETAKETMHRWDNMDYAGANDLLQKAIRDLEVSCDPRALALST